MRRRCNPATGNTSGGPGPPGPAGAAGPPGPPGSAGPEGPPPTLVEVYVFDDQIIGAVEHSLTNNSTLIADLADPGIYWLWVDASALVAGDQYQFFVRERVTPGSAQQQYSVGIGADLELEPLIFGPFALFNGWDFTAIRLSTTADRTFSWSIRKE